MKGTLHRVAQVTQFLIHFKQLDNKSPNCGLSTIWVVRDEVTKDEYRLTDNSLSTQDGYRKNLIEGELVKYKVIINYGIDPYDNQIHGIDYYDAGDIIKHIKDK